MLWALICRIQLWKAQTGMVHACWSCCSVSWSSTHQHMCKATLLLHGLKSCSLVAVCACKCGVHRDAIGISDNISERLTNPEQHLATSVTCSPGLGNTSAGGYFTCFGKAKEHLGVHLKLASLIRRFFRFLLFPGFSGPHPHVSSLPVTFP